MPLSELYKASRAVYSRSSALAFASAVFIVGVPLSWFTGRIRMDKPTPWLVWLASIVVFAYYLIVAIKYLRRSEEERWRSGE